MKRSLITGTSSGIGLELAREALARGHEVFGVSRRATGDLEAEANYHHSRIDLTEHARVPGELAALLGATLHLDCVVLNAGVLGPIADLADVDLDAMRSVMDTNLWANKTVLDALFDHCSTVDRVVAISSGAAVTGHRGWAGYAVSKAALNMLVQLYAAERLDTHFCAFAPGIIDTAMQDLLCGMDSDPRFPSLDGLRGARGTADMPTAATAASRLWSLIEDLPDRVASGAYFDARSMA